MKQLLLGLLLLSSLTGNAALLIPEDYESINKFFKVTKEQNSRRVQYKFYECIGDKVDHTCSSIFDEQGYSKSELNSIESSEAMKGSGLLVAEVITGGIIWKRLMKFTLGGAVKVAARVTKSSEGVANGAVALAVMTPTNAGATVYVLKKTNDVLNIVDPFSRFKRSELIDTDEYESKTGLVPLGYDYQEAYLVLDELLGNIQ